MARILADGSVNRKGRTYFLFVLATESGVFAIPFWYALRLHNVNFDPDNSEFHALSCYFPFETVCYLIIASAIVGACLGFLNTEIITAGDTYLRGLATLQQEVVILKVSRNWWLRYHKITQLHVLWEFSLWIYGFQVLQLWFRSGGVQLP